MKLAAQYIEKPWGRSSLPAMFEQVPDRRIGEVWFVGDDGLPLLAKYLFTSEPLSVQVHPNDEQARARGLPRGKSECWYILDAEPEARIGLGLVEDVEEADLRSAALDGSIEEMIRWWPVSAGEFIYVEPGTIHAIGSGLSLLEIQQNSDVTFRLFDYGRPRELHLDDAIAVANRGPYPAECFQRVDPTNDRTLVDGLAFTIVHSHEDAMQDRVRWAVPLEGTISCRGEVARSGECMLLNRGDQLATVGARLLLGAATGA